jgi:hypothetical protein
MQFLRPYSTLLVGMLIGAFLIPRVLSMVGKRG